jgi:hypothetical protein
MKQPIAYTLSDLILSLQQVTSDDREVVAAITHLINSGAVRLRGRFAGAQVTLASAPSGIARSLIPSLPKPLPRLPVGKAKRPVQLAA